MRLPTILRLALGLKAFRWIDVAELASKNEHRTIIDVRGEDEFLGPLGHIADARNLPVRDLPERLHWLDTLRDQPVILVCRTDKRSAHAAALLHDAGFRDVRVLRGGMEEWKRQGLPVATGSA